MLKKLKAVLLPLLVAATAIATVPSYAHASKVPEVVLDGERLRFTVEPRIIHGTTFVPLRGILEKQGAEVVWDSAARSVQATKGLSRFTYAIGETEAYLDERKIHVSVPGYIEKGTTLVPLRLVSEALGSSVTWNQQSGVISISTRDIVETVVAWGVNFRSHPNTDSEIYRMLPRGESVQVLQEIGEYWLQVQTKEGLSGYISALPKYTEYAAAKAADRLIAYGETFLGRPYEFGAAPDQVESFDCSSFVKHVFREVLGIDLPRVSYNQVEVGEEVQLKNLRKGDLLFFSARGLPVGHVAIYAGEGQLLHTYSVKHGVEFRAFEGQWMERFVTARRVF